jgi:hypothetical protein
MQLDMFNTIRDDLSPYRAIGSQALPGVAQLLGLSSGQPATVMNPAVYQGGFGGLTGVGAPAGGGAAAQPDFAGYVQNNPDLLAAYQANPSFGTSYPLSLAQWGQAHWTNNGQQEGRTLTPFGAPNAAPQGVPGGDYADYVRNNPDLVKGFTANPNAFGANGDINAWGKAHWENYGSKPGETRTYTPQTGSIQSQLAGKTPTQTYLESLPGYQFTKQQGLQAVENSLNAKGLGGLSGSLGKGIARFVTGLADQTYGSQLDRMMGLVNVGQSAANQTGTFGQNATTAAGGALTGGANAAAAGQVGVAGAIGSGLTGAANAALTSQLLGMYGKKG